MDAETRKTVLIVSYHFAPSPAVGAKRFSYLAREFERLGYDVRVVAANLRDSQHGSAIPDLSLPEAKSVRRCAETKFLPVTGRGLRGRIENAFWRRALAPVGWEYFWTRPAVGAALTQAGSASHGVVIATVPPPACALAGTRIARQLGWPLILDYRDPWSAYPWPEWRKGRTNQWFAKKIEAQCVERSAARVLNTPAMQDWFERYFPKAARERNFVIPNGFDAADSEREPAQDGPLEVVHAGAVYTDRSLLPALRAIAALVALNPGRNVKLVTYGTLPEVERGKIKAEGLEKYLDVRTRISRDELFERLQRAHALLVVSGDDMTYSVPYKTYDYLATGRPILAVASRGSALHRFMSDSGAGLCVTPDDAASMERALEKLLFEPVAVTDRRAVEGYQWANLALKYRTVIESACKS